MKKAISFKNIGQKMLVLALVFGQLFLAACKPKSEAKENDPTPEPKIEAQLQNNSGKIGDEETAITPTAEPIEPAEELTKNEYFLFFPTEAQLSQLEKEASELRKRLESITNGEFNAMSYGNYTIFEIVKILSGDFSEIDGETLEAGTAANIVSNLASGYMIIIRNCGSKIGNNELKGLGIANPKFSNIFNIAGFENYNGAETVKFLEDEIDELYNILDIKNKDSKEYLEKGKEITTFIEQVLFEQNSEYKEKKLTNFYEMHPLIKLVFSMYAEGASGFIVFSIDQTKKSNQDLVKRIIKIEDEFDNLRKNEYIKQELIDLIDTYTAIADQGIYDAYMSGGNTRKKIMQQLC